MEKYLFKVNEKDNTNTGSSTFIVTLNKYFCLLHSNFAEVVY